ncbi:hypothetical protein, partial [Rivihabitans pingtungensis]|uniref:hypothetical protein n=1 Tax=Rivihabitans pingtungensis TaxID=1054498 RepID=UPI0023EFC416
QMNAAVFVQQAAKAVEVGRGNGFQRHGVSFPAESSRPRPKNGGKRLVCLRLGQMGNFVGG